MDGLVKSAVNSDADIAKQYKRLADIGPAEPSISYKKTACFWVPFIVLNCHLQAWILITGWILPSFLVQILLTPFYALDMILYSMDRIGWSENRRQIFGPVFVGLGKVNLAGYDEVAKVISNPQLRGNYLGRTKLVGSRLPKVFPLNMSNLPNDTAHRMVRGTIVNAFFSQASTARSGDSTATAMVKEFVAELKAKKGTAEYLNNGTATVPYPSDLIVTFVRRWMHYVVLGIELKPNTELLTTVVTATKNFTATRVDVCCSAPGSCYKETEEETATLDAYLALSPYFRSLKADASLPGFESPRALAYTIMSIMSIAAILGGEATMCAALSSNLESVPVPIGAEQDDALTAFIVEAGRLFNPVNYINVMIDEPETFQIGWIKYCFPRGTNVAASLLMGSLDSKKFENPLQFKADREGAEKNTLVFNSVGVAADENPYGKTAKERVCPGRFLALSMVKQVLRAYHA